MSEHAEPGRRRFASVGFPGAALPGLSAFVADRVNDAISLLRFLPDIAAALKSIDAHVANVDAEVHLMRLGVDRLDGEVRSLRGDIQSLSADLEGVAERIERLEPHVADLSRLARPLRRMRGRTANGERRAGDPAQLTPSGEAAGSAEADPTDT
jgi:uncharacterized protein YoxC